MRKLILMLIAIALVSALLTAGAGVALGAPALTLVNLTRDGAVERNPSIECAGNGDVFVAWAQDVLKNGVAQSDIVARVEQAGVFGLAVNISNSAAASSEPWLFPVGTASSVVYPETVGGPESIFRSDWSGAAWSAPQLIAGGDYAGSEGPVGVQSTDGRVWLARWVHNSSRRSYLVVQQLGGPSFVVSQGGSVTRHPALVAGEAGEVYAVWVDHTSQPAGKAPGLRAAKVTASGVVQLPQPSTDYYAYWPAAAYRGGQLYVAWVATSLGLVRERVWNGLAWARQVNIAKGDTPRVAVTAGQNVYVTWQASGRIYLKKNLLAPVVVSEGMRNASKPALAVDSAENAHVAFAAGGDIWYVQVAGP
ncbi:MAG: hypothetical protein WCF84_14875 [Anaerolineae bacterium]